MFALLNRLMAVLALCGAVEADTAMEDTGPIEINPLEYLPLEVGNRWTYEHVYASALHGEMKGLLPLEDEWSFPIDPLPYPEQTVTIEITHTEVIDGLEYFVFSEADYAWPPFPSFFFEGKKVRLSDEGILMFRWEGQDIPVYDFGATSNPHRYVGTFPRGSSTEQFSVGRIYTPYQRPRVDFSINNSPFLQEIAFLKGYGVGRVYIHYWSAYPGIYYRNGLIPISATISGEEILYEQVRSASQSFESSGLGQIGQVRTGEGFDFSQGKHSESSNDFELVPFYPFNFEGENPQPIYFFSSETGVADLGKMDFGLMISKGIPGDARVKDRVGFDFSFYPSPYQASPQGRIYAVWSREGGVALLYVFGMEFVEGTGIIPVRYIRYIRFDWVYYPDGLPDKDTAVQPISWGQLKHLIRGRSSSSQDSPQVGRRIR